MGGLEPPTSASQTRRAGRLRYTPADKSIIRNMDKRQEIYSFPFSTILLILALFILVGFGLTACQSQPSMPSILFNQPTGTPSADLADEVQTTMTVSAPPQSTPGAENNHPTRGCLEQAGVVEAESIFSESLKDDLHLQVYLPPCYHDFTEHNYPVVYLLHGLYFDEDQWLRLGVAEQMDRLITAGEIAAFIIILPRETRFDPLQTSPFADALTEELIPWVDQHYRTLPEKHYRAIGGLSRGAAWSIRIGLLHYPLFDSVGAHSLPGFQVNTGRFAAIIEQVPNHELPSFFIDIGNRDPERTAAQSFADQLNDYNIPHTWYLFNGDHSETYWSAHLEYYLRWYSRNW